MPPRPALRLLACSLPLLLAACGGSGGDDDPPPAPEPTPNPLQSYLDQPLTWAACDPTILGYEAEAMATLGDRVRCATIKAPLDYAHPDRGNDVTLALLRVQAGTPDQRRGAMLMNPGGPGIDGLGLAVDMGELWALGNPVSEIGLRLRQVSDQYDLISFSPRGVGASTQLTCATNEHEKPTSFALKNHSAENSDNLLYNDRLVTTTCAKNPVTPYINTDATARDMDLMRALIGDDKLNYLGYSYGTWLGAWYSAIFPENAGRIVLDSSMDFTTSAEGTWLLKGPAFQYVYEEILASYATRHPGHFGLGTSVEAIRAIYPTLSAPLQEAVDGALIEKMFSRKGAHSALALLAAAQTLNTLIAEQPEAEPEEIAEQLETLVFAPDDEEQNTAIRKRAMMLLAELTQEPMPSQSMMVSASSATFAAVSCNDAAWNRDLTFWRNLNDDYASRQLLWTNLVLSSSCPVWGEPTVQKPSLASAANLDILMVQSQYDSPTALPGALHTFEALPQARMIYVPNEYTHGVFPYDTSCVDVTVADYFLGTTPAARQTTCEARPLPLDATASARQVHTPTYLNAARAETLRERIQERLITPMP